MGRGYKITSIDESLENEIIRIMEEANKRGYNITRREASAIVEYKSRKGKLTDNELKLLIRQLRGVI